MRVSSEALRFLATCIGGEVQESGVGHEGKQFED